MAENKQNHKDSIDLLEKQALKNQIKRDLLISNINLWRFLIMLILSFSGILFVLFKIKISDEASKMNIIIGLSFAVVF